MILNAVERTAVIGGLQDDAISEERGGFELLGDGGARADDHDYHRQHTHKPGYRHHACAFGPVRM